MKKIIYYLGIIILFSLAVTPPILRIALPDQDKKEDKKINKEMTMLVCTSDKYMTVTNYEDEKINRIMLKKINQINNEITEEQEEISNVNTNELDTYFNELTLNGDILHNEVADGQILTIDYSVSNHSNLKIDNLTNSIEKQKNIYQSYGLTCEIRK